MPDRRADLVFAYHRRTKHQPWQYARSLGFMDWDTQPDPFRRYDDAPSVALDLVPAGDEPRYEPVFRPGNVSPAPLDLRSVSQLFQDALGLSAWKEIVADGQSHRWSLRMNPSSGNLHPTEGYLVCGASPGLRDGPAVWHYAPFEHRLERRAAMTRRDWETLTAGLPPDAILVGLTSIWWRESWKYGERAFRYCQHDLGHAMGAVAVAAAGLGWEVRLLEGAADSDIAALIGVAAQSGPDAEHAECLLTLFPAGAPFPRDRWCAWRPTLPAVVAWSGSPNRLSADHHDWPVIDEVAGATRRDGPPRDDLWDPAGLDNSRLSVGDSPLSLRRVVHQRRSAVALDGKTGIERSAFVQIMTKSLPGRDQVPYCTLPWRPRVDLLLFVHRVAGVDPGLYTLVRDPSRADLLRTAMDPSFLWERPAFVPEDFPLFLLQRGDCRSEAAGTSCGQDIAADGAFAAAMLAEFEEPIHRFGPWFYRRLHWEAGLLGQVLYLEAEASGIRATGIGCFFDDSTHKLFGLRDDRFQVLYHFTMGGPVEDPRLQTLAPYHHLTR